MKRIKEGIYEVGALNPAMRVFDIVMTTDYGTSYNIWLKGRRKPPLSTSATGAFLSHTSRTSGRFATPRASTILS